VTVNIVSDGSFSTQANASASPADCSGGVDDDHAAAGGKAHIMSVAKTIACFSFFMTEERPPYRQLRLLVKYAQRTAKLLCNNFYFYIIFLY
jgi:hypothetical protein